jgi:hypothetical protein
MTLTPEAIAFLKNHRIELLRQLNAEIESQTSIRGPRWRATVEHGETAELQRALTQLQDAHAAIARAVGRQV